MGALPSIGLNRHAATRGPARARTNVRSTVSGRRVAIPLVLTLIAAATFLPEELSFFVFGLRLTVARLIFLLLIPTLVIRLGKKIASRQYRFVVSDAAIVLTGVWMIYAPANIDGFQPALNHAGPTVLELWIGYGATRLLLREHGQALSFASLLCSVIAVVAVLALLDPLTDRNFIHEMAGQLTGYGKPAILRDEDWPDTHRFGLLRASGSIEHAILLGYTCSVGFLIGISVPLRSRVAIIACGLGVIIALSSAPLQGLMMGLALLVYDKLLRRMPFRWAILIGLGALGVVAAFLISDSPVGFIVSHLTYDASTGYYRIYTWTQVIGAVGQSPWYGLGFAPQSDQFDINHTIDSLWLVTSMVSGVPGVALLMISMLGTASLPTSGAGVALTPAESRLGTTLGIVTFLTIFMAFTVHFWGSSWILVALLMGLRAHLGELGRIRRPSPEILRSSDERFAAAPTRA